MNNYQNYNNYNNQQPSMGNYGGYPPQKSNNTKIIIILLIIILLGTVTVSSMIIGKLVISSENNINSPETSQEAVVPDDENNMNDSGDENNSVPVVTYEPTPIPTPVPTPIPTPPPVPGKDFVVYKGDYTSTGALQSAMAMGGTLGSIDSVDDFKKATALANSKGLKVCWVSNNSQYLKWLPGEPSYYDKDGTPEYYYMLIKSEGVWYFNDAPNDVTRYYKGKIGYLVEF